MFPLNQENTDHITEKMIESIFATKEYYEIIPELIKMIHCNPSEPRNHNIRVEDELNTNSAYCYNGKRFECRSRIELYNEIILKAEIVLRCVAVKRVD